tara:strand:+ start:556 stop:741 length:186 start_codon:yes stop_codon:yes gene_type:complete
MSVLQNIIDLKEKKIVVKELSQTSCVHENKSWQPYEPEVNASESLSCEDCGCELELPEESF